MSLHDRHYARGPRGGSDGFSGGGFGSGTGGPGGFLGGLFAFLNLSFPIGRWFGIRVRVHILFVLLLLTRLLPDRQLSEWGLGWGEQALWTLRWTGLLFVSVLLHEFGHCFGCRAVGGQADDILMWPLGGLAYCDPPRRPWPEFVTVACGPLVNVVLGGVSYVVLLSWLGTDSPVSLHPFHMFVGYHESAAAMLIADLFAVNYGLLLFNLLLIFYPFDGGRLVQVALWKALGYGRSMVIATNMGMVGAVIVAVVGLWQSHMMLVMIAAFGFLTCHQQRQQLKYAAEAEPEYDPRFAAAYESVSGRKGTWFTGRHEGQPSNRGPGLLARLRQDRRLKRDAAQRRRQAANEAEINRILDKVHSQGLSSLTRGEREALRQATDGKKER